MFPPLLQSPAELSVTHCCTPCALALKVTLDGAFAFHVSGKGTILFELTPVQAPSV